MDVLNVSLPKWPALGVVGDPITPEQAAEILIRTDRFTLDANDRDFCAALRDVAGVAGHGWESGGWESRKAARERFGVLALEYLTNDRIVSSYIKGPRGWCDWSGRIGCNSYNVGKWPSVAEVFEEWRLVAATFPYLSLRAQLYSGEHGEEEIVPLVEYVVTNGVVTLKRPTVSIPIYDEPLSEAAIIGRHFGFERGCTIEQFAKALTLAEAGKNRRLAREGASK